MFCKKCGQQIDDGAAFCAHCGQAVNESLPTSSQSKSEINPVRKKQKATGLILGAFAALCILAIALINGSDDAEHTPTNNTDPIVTYIEVSPQELFEQYDTNEVAADNQYKGKELKVTGTIKDIGKDILDHTYITLDTGNLICSVQCYFENNQLDAVAELKKDQIITLVGKCNGQSMNVILKNSVIVSVTDATTENTIPGETTTGTTAPIEQQPEETQAVTAGATTGEKNALRSANNYLQIMAFSYNGLIEQLEFDGYTNEEATYAANNCGADWNEQALREAQNYLKTMAFSYEGLIDQLEFEKYTNEQATYGADNCGADWNEQAVRKAKSYLDTMPFSRSGLIDQLVFDGFTYEQAEYGVDANDL